jgi:hypothetical protein
LNLTDYSRKMRAVEWASMASLRSSDGEPDISALGQKLSSGSVRGKSVHPSTADIGLATVRTQLLSGSNVMECRSSGYVRLVQIALQKSFASLNTYFPSSRCCDRIITWGDYFIPEMNSQATSATGGRGTLNKKHAQCRISLIRPWANYDASDVHHL